MHIDFENKLLRIPYAIENDQSVIIPPRSNCVITINAEEAVGHDIIAIQKQETNEDVIIANSLSPVHGNKTVSNIINISKQPFVIDELSTENLQWEPYSDHVFFINSDRETQTMGTKRVKDTTDRITLLNEAIKTDNLNVEERDSIIDLCNKYSDIFFLENDYLNSTDVVKHYIKTPRCVKPINRHP